MSGPEQLAVLGAGFGAGVLSSTVGVASLLSFPVLVALGLPPVVANASNTVGLIPAGLSGSFGYRAELREHRADLERQLAEVEDQVHQAPNPELLGHLPISPVDLVGMPDALSRQLFEALRLEIRYNQTTNLAVCQITLTGQIINTVAHTAEQATAIPFQRRDRVSRDHKEHMMTTERIRPAASFCVVPPAGLEPAAKCLEGTCSIR